ncbi:MAG TPA: heme-copper oxidase subunit III [Candidatus Dormibacteraeota bacterium]|nr:heme-copper oxidase subunit III [Candidatus Dormibacteraeota bacterium]
MAVASIHPEKTPQYPAIKPGMTGMYIFLASEVMFFGSLFAVYFYLYGSHIVWPPPPPTTSEFYVNWYPVPVINTIVLFSSAFTCHFGADALARDNRRRFYILWTATILLGLAFEFGQLYEFISAFGRGMSLTANSFASAFFIMTGFHGAHVLGGLVLLSLILYRAAKGQFSSRHHVGVAAVTLYWHFVDVVWFFLFTILYVGVALFR